MVTLHEVITFLVSMQISISSLHTHNVNRCGRSRHLARKLSLRRKRSSPNVFEMAATETITSIILIKLIRVSLGTTNVRSSLMAVNIHITIIELNALHTKRQNLFQELDAVIHLLMEAKHWGLRKSRNATSLNSRF